jgi:uncharacterized protein
MGQEQGILDQNRIISALARVVAAEAGSVQIYETHISWILCAGLCAYKIKKAVQFDFLDFSTLEARRYYCHEELRLNRRLAPSLYLDVVPVTGSEGDPRLGGNGPPIEYAVKMQAFPQRALWSQRVIHGELTHADMHDLAHELARFHRCAPVAGTETRWGSPAILQKLAAESLCSVQSLAGTVAEKDAVQALQDWQASQDSQLAATFVQRKAGGAVRECHGDLHIGNILTLDGRVLAFDCIEFSECLRWIDVVNDIGFVCMDLCVHGQRALAAGLLDSYLGATGDYAGMALLQYYQIQCALVRWKIALMKSQYAATGNGPAAAENRALAARYMTFAIESIGPMASAIVVMHGYSGSGKSTVAGHLVELLHGVRIRSDVERKRMHGLDANAKAAAPYGGGLYDNTATDATYMRLAMIASQVVESGAPVIVDATFLLRKQRRQFDALASALGVPYFIVEVRAGKGVLEARLEARTRQEPGPSDAGIAVLSHQLSICEPLSADERAHAIAIDSDAGLTCESTRSACMPIANAIAAMREQRKGGVL